MIVLLLALLAACSGDPDDTAPVADPFAASMVSFTPGEGAGYGADVLPDVVLGTPVGAGDRAGSTDVVSLGCDGEIVLTLGVPLVDRDGPDLLVFENPFVGWTEPGVVAASADGTTWQEWACDAEDSESGYPGCAGTHPVWSAPGNGVDPTDPSTAGGDPFDLADLGLTEAAYVRITDAGVSPCAAPTGGFDLDALAVVGDEDR